MEQERHKKEQKMKEYKNIECKMVWKDKKEGKKEIRKYGIKRRKGRKDGKRDQLSLYIHS